MEKTAYTVATIILLSLMSVSVMLMPSVGADTLHVGSGQTYATIQDAINASSNGDTVYVHAGMYNEQIVVNKTISMIGESRTNTTVNGTGRGGEPTIHITVDLVNISGFEIIGAEVDESGIFIANAENCTINDCYVHANTDMGIEATYAHNLTISQCNVSYNGKSTGHGYNIYVEYSDDVTIINCGVHRPISEGSEEGYAYNVYCDTTERVVIENVSARARGLTAPNGGYDIGIKVKGGDYAVIRDCNVYQNKTGDSWFKGIHVTNSNHAVIENNTIVGCFVTIGLEYDKSHYGIIRRNNISSCAKGIFFESSCCPESHDAYIFLNNLNNTVNAEEDATGTNYWYNETLKAGNWWSNYDESTEGAWDNNSDGRADDAYSVPGDSGGSDMYPLVNPYNRTLPAYGGTLNISLSPKSKDFGTVSLGEEYSTTDYYFNLTNNGAACNIIINVSNSQNWTFINFSQSRHDVFCVNFSDDNWSSETNINTTGTTVTSNLATGMSFLFDLKFILPTSISSSSNGEEIIITLKATAT